MLTRLASQLAFIAEIDRLKGVLRQTLLCDRSRQENTAEHSWHLAMAAIVLAEYAGDDVDIRRVIRMALVHDIVEIDAGDTFAYDAKGNLDREKREQVAAERVFGMLPAEQATELRGLWEEFEVGRSPDARFAVALDRLQPLLLNHHSQGGSWRAHNITRDQVLRRMQPIEAALPALWPQVLEIVEQNCTLGHIRR
jgi:putative hydrolases of HD superfamily